MNHFTAGDWAIIGLYLVGVLILGVLLGKGQQSTRDYFLGGRNIPWWSVGFSIVATETSALTFIGIPALAYGGDLAFIQIVVGYVLARILLAVLLVPHYFKGDIYSPYQLLQNAFGSPACRMASVLFLIAGTLAAGVRVYVTCIPIDLMMGDLLESFLGANRAIHGAIVLFVGLSLIYTYVGGIKAVVWTDAIQFVFLLGGGLFALFYLPSLWEGGWSTAVETAGAAGKLDWFHGGFDVVMPYNIWMGLIGATVMAMFTHGADQLVVQRILACRSEREGRKALILSAVIIFPMFLIFLLVGVLLWVYDQQVGLAMALPESQAGFKQNDYIFPAFILTATPPVIKGLLIVGILSAAMSSVSSALAALGSVSVMDLLKPSPIKRIAGREINYLKLSRLSTVFWGLMLVMVALACQGQTYVLDLAFSLSGLTAGAMLGGLLLAVFGKSRPWPPVVIGMAASLLAMIFIRKAGWERVVDGVPTQVSIAWPWLTLIGTTITLAVTLTLERFFRKGVNHG